MFRTRSSLSRLDQVSTTADTGHSVITNDASLGTSTSRFTASSLRRWVNAEISKATKGSRQQPASHMEASTSAPVKCTCGAKTAVPKTEIRQTETLKIIRLKDDTQKTLELQLELNQKDYHLQWKVELPDEYDRLPVEFDQVLRRKIDEELQRQINKPNYQGPDKPLECEVVFNGDHSTYFQKIDPIRGARGCCDGTEPCYFYTVLSDIVREAVGEVLPGFNEDLGANFDWLVKSCCPAGYVERIKTSINWLLELDARTGPSPS